MATRSYAATARRPSDGRDPHAPCAGAPLVESSSSLTRRDLANLISRLPLRIFVSTAEPAPAPSADTQAHAEEAVEAAEEEVPDVEDTGCEDGREQEENQAGTWCKELI